MSTQEVKGNLARLLATENLTVEHKVCQTASFDTDKRILTLPVWEVSDKVYDLLVEHEVGHALFTPNDDWSEVLQDVPKSFLNVTEDARIEKLMKRKFPGVNKDFYKGYQELNEDDFFGISNEDVSQLHLIDRINLYYKIGSFAMLPFNDAEIVLRDATGRAETFEDAIQCAKDIYLYEKRKQDAEEMQSPEEGNTDIGMTSDSPAPTNGEGETLEIESKKSKGDADQKESEDGQEITEVETNIPQGGYDAGDLYAKTDQSLEERLAEKASTNNYHSPKYVELPNVDSDFHMTTPEFVQQQCDAYWGLSRFNDPNETFYNAIDWTQVDADYASFKKQIGREVSYLNKEFEMKKAATAYARASISKTGVLDTKKLYSYKYNDDIFKKVTRTKDGKNHGLIFILDWSGSMHECILDTYKQLLSLALFCRKANIAFSAHCFANENGAHYPANFDEDKWAKTQKDDTVYVAPSMCLQGLFNSSQNNESFEKSALYLFRVASVYAANRYYHRGFAHLDRPNIPDTSVVPSVLGMGGTPLNETLCVLDNYIPKFKSKYGVEKVNVALLTDGEAQWSRRWTTIDYRDGKHRSVTCIETSTQLRHRKSAQTFKTEGAYKLTEAMLRYLKTAHPYVNFLGFRLGTTRDIFYSLQKEFDGAKLEKMKRVWRKNKTLSATVSGYDEHYFIALASLNVDSAFEVEENASNAAIKKAFQKSLNVKANNKSILSSFIKQIA